MYNEHANGAEDLFQVRWRTFTKLLELKIISATAVYMRQWTESACRLFRTKLLLEPILLYCQLDC